MRVGEGQHCRRDVLVGELVVGAARRLGQPALGGEHAPEWFWLACLWPPRIWGLQAGPGPLSCCAIAFAADPTVLVLRFLPGSIYYGVSIAVALGVFAGGLLTVVHLARTVAPAAA